MHRSLRIAAATLLVLAVGTPARAQTDATVAGLIAGQGAGDINDTKGKYAVHGTDLGFMWRDSRGRVALMFGDTYGEGWGHNGAGPASADWRMNVLAFSTDTTLSDGMTIDSMVTDRPNHAKQLIGRWLPRIFEETVIPTAGVSVGGRDYVHYMSIRSWDPWVTNYAGLAYSDDGGQNWVKSTTAWWPNSGGLSNFQLGAFVRDSGYVYLFGTPNGRFGNAHLLRVPEARVLDVASYEYWTAAGWQRSADGGIPVMSGQVGELSVQYNAFLGKWVAMHLDEQRTAIVMRTAPSLTGPWTGGEVVAHGRDHPGLYGGFQHPDSGADLYFAMSEWQPYHVQLMKLPLAGRGMDTNLAQNGGFEDWPGTWRFNGQGGVDLGKDLAHSGRNNGWVRGTSGWHDMHEQIVVQPGQRYRITGWVRSSESNTDGYFGVRAGNRVVAEQKFGSYHDYTRLSVEFVADTPSLDVYAGMWAVHGDTWVQVDDVALEVV